MLLAALQAHAVCDDEAQRLVEQLVIGLPATQDADLSGWLVTVAQIATQARSQPPPLGAPSGDRLRHSTYLVAPTWAELEELEQRVAALARQLPRPYG
jgi:hypothetical protein